MTVFLPSVHPPDLTPVDRVWAHAKHSLANLDVVALDRLDVRQEMTAGTGGEPGARCVGSRSGRVHFCIAQGGGTRLALI